MVIKSKTFSNFFQDVQKTFKALRKMNMKLNSRKCTFGVGGGIFLRYIISDRDIKLDPEKVQALINMAVPRTVKEVQSLNGRLASLNKFLSHSAQWSLPFFKILKVKTTKEEEIKWTPEANATFQDLKRHLLELPTLTTPVPSEIINVYLAVIAKLLPQVYVL